MRVDRSTITATCGEVIVERVSKTAPKYANPILAARVETAFRSASAKTGAFQDKYAPEGSAAPFCASPQNGVSHIHNAAFVAAQLRDLAHHLRRLAPPHHARPHLFTETKYELADKLERLAAHVRY